jgi:hypothetical protein
MAWSNMSAVGRCSSVALMRGAEWRRGKATTTVDKIRIRNARIDRLFVHQSARHCAQRVQLHLHTKRASTCKNPPIRGGACELRIFSMGIAV